MTDWKVLLIVYRRIEVRYKAGWFRSKDFAYELSEEEVSDALNSLRIVS